MCYWIPVPSLLCIDPPGIPSKPSEGEVTLARPIIAASHPVISPIISCITSEPPRSPPRLLVCTAELLLTTVIHPTISPGVAAGMPAYSFWNNKQPLILILYSNLVHCRRLTKMCIDIEEIRSPVESNRVCFSDLRIYPMVRWHLFRLSWTWKCKSWSWKSYWHARNNSE